MRPNPDLRGLLLKPYSSCHRPGPQYKHFLLGVGHLGILGAGQLTWIRASDFYHWTISPHSFTSLGGGGGREPVPVPGSTRVEVRGVRSFLLTGGSEGHQAWMPTPLPSEPSQGPRTQCIINSFIQQKLTRGRHHARRQGRRKKWTFCLWLSSSLISIWYGEAR